MSKPAIPGYRQLTEDQVTAISAFKVAEEHVLGMLDELAETAIEIDPRWLATGRTQIEQGFMAVNRSIARPERLSIVDEAGE